MSWWTVHSREVRYVPSVAPVAWRSFTPPHLKLTTNRNAKSDKMPGQGMATPRRVFANVGSAGGNLLNRSSDDVAGCLVDLEETE